MSAAELFLEADSQVSTLLSLYDKRNYSEESMIEFNKARFLLIYTLAHQETP